MRTYILLMAAVLLVGCGSETGDRKQYFPDCMNHFYMDPVLQVNEHTLEENIQRVQFVMIDNGLVGNKEAWCDEFQDVPVYVIPYQGWDCDPPNEDGTKVCAKGWYDGMDGITMSRDMDQLAHEFIHAWELNRGNPFTGSHPFWEQKRGDNHTLPSFYDIAQEYTDSFEKPVYANEDQLPTIKE